MKFEQVKVEVKNAVKAKLSLYIQESYPQMYGDRKRPMILICPGGGYEHVSVREGEPIAFQFLAAGCNMMSQGTVWCIRCRLWSLHGQFPISGSMQMHMR